MAGRVTLEVIEGPMQGREFPFDAHATFLFGRSPDCHACLPGDPYVSRHHFLLEANPPDARIRDLGSLNGTYVNGVKHGGRQKDETPEQGRAQEHPQVDLRDGDQVKVGRTVFAVRVSTPVVCAGCGAEVPAGDVSVSAALAAAPLCAACRENLAEPAGEVVEPPLCRKCGKDVADEIGAGRSGDYLCETCRAAAEEDPGALLQDLVRQALAGSLGRPAAGPPAISGYTMGGLIRKGGMGAVYRATRQADGRPVAVKVMLSRTAVDAHTLKAFEREIEITRGLRHQHIVEFLEYGFEGGCFYFVLEFCDGGSVDGLMEKMGGKVPVPAACQIQLQALAGLAYAHALGFVHRDLKPQNLLLSGAPGHRVAKVADFGLAKNFEAAGFSGMTVTGERAGTVDFMPREQITDYKRVTPVSDVWSMGATFYNMITGAVPRELRPGQDPANAILTGAIVPVRARDASIPTRIAEVIETALKNDPADRYQNAAEMRAALQRVL